MTLSPLGTVDWARTAFRCNPSATDDELVQILVEAGLPQASRAVVMLVIAFGRTVLRDMVELSSTYGVGGVEYLLSDDPIYAAADYLSHTEPARDDVERMGMHSSEVGVVNHALASGHAAESLLLSPPELFFGPDTAPALADPQEVLDGVVLAHGSGAPFTCLVRPLDVSRGRVLAQLDFCVRVDHREIVESFSGVGSTIGEALADGFKKFTQGSLHVMIAIVDRVHLDADQVTWETWGSFDVCLGPLLRLCSTRGPSEFGSYLDGVKDLLLRADLSPDIHWLRTFVGSDGHELIGREMMLDNAPWVPGEQVLTAFPWPVADGPYAVRHFLALIPHGPGPGAGQVGA